MASVLNQVSEAALRLPEEERLELASRLVDSVEGPAEPGWERAWADELEQRRRGDWQDASDWAEVRAAALRSLAED